MSAEQILIRLINSAAFSQGLHDALHVGRYDQEHHDRLREDSPSEASSYKTAYDVGITLYCEANNLTD